MDRILADDPLKEEPKKKNNTRMIMWVFFVIILAAAAYLIFFNSNSNSPNENNSTEVNPDMVQVYFFWSATCSHCAAQKPFMEEMKQKYNEMQLLSYEIQFDPDNFNFLKDKAREYGMPEEQWGWVPVTFIGDKYFLGYSDSIAVDMENKIKEEISKK